MSLHQKEFSLITWQPMKTWFSSVTSVENHLLHPDSCSNIRTLIIPKKTLLVTMTVSEIFSSPTSLSDTSSTENSNFQVCHTSMTVSEIFSTPTSLSDTSSTENSNFQVFHTSMTRSEIFSTPPITRWLFLN